MVNSAPGHDLLSPRRSALTIWRALYRSPPDHDRIRPGKRHVGPAFGPSGPPGRRRRSANVKKPYQSVSGRAREAFRGRGMAWSGSTGSRASWAPGVVRHGSRWLGVAWSVWPGWARCGAAGCGVVRPGLARPGAARLGHERPGFRSVPAPAARTGGGRLVLMGSIRSGPEPDVGRAPGLRGSAAAVEGLGVLRGGRTAGVFGGLHRRAVLRHPRGDG